MTDEAISTLLPFEAMGYDFIIDDEHLIVEADPYEFEEPVLRRILDSLTPRAQRIDPSADSL